MVVVLAGSVWADVPALMNFQGRLPNDKRASVNLTFSLWTAASGGAQHGWFETYTVQTDADGIFNVTLGSNLPLPWWDVFRTYNDVYLQVDRGATVNSDRFSPRQRIISVPYAMRASYAETLGGASVGQLVRKVGDTMTGPLGVRSTADNNSIFQDGSDWNYTELAQHSWGGSHGILFGAYKDIKYDGGLLTNGNCNFARAVGGYSFGAGSIIYDGNGGTMYFAISPPSAGKDQKVEWGTPVLTLTRGGNVGIGTTDPGTAKLAVMNGNVGIGTTSPGAKLHISNGNIGLDNGYALSSKMGNGTMSWIMYMDGSNKTHVRGSGGGLSIDNYSQQSLLSIEDTGVATLRDSLKVGLNTVPSIAIEAATNTGDAIYGYATTSGIGVYGSSSSGAGVAGNSSSNAGVLGISGTNYGVAGYSTSSAGIYGQATSGYGVYGKTTGSGYAGYFSGKTWFSGGPVGIISTNNAGLTINTSNSNCLVLNNTGNTYATIWDDTGANLSYTGNWNNASDKSKKKNIKDIKYGLKETLMLKPVSFTWKKTGEEDIGFIAQDVKRVIPEVVHGAEGNLSLSYGQMAALLTKAIQEQQKTISELKSKNDKLEARLKAIEAKLK